MSQPAGPISSGTVISSAKMHTYVTKHMIRWTERKETLTVDRDLLQLRLAVAAIEKEANTVVVTQNADPRTNEQLRTSIRMLKVECSVMKWELRFLTHIFNARKGKAADIDAAAAAMAGLHEKRVEALETITEADVSSDMDLMAIISTGSGQSVHKNGGGVRAIADQYMFRHQWESEILALCRAGAYGD